MTSVPSRYKPVACNAQFPALHAVAHPFKGATENATQQGGDGKGQPRAVHDPAAINRELTEEQGVVARFCRLVRPSSLDRPATTLPTTARMLYSIEILITQEIG